MADNPDPVQFPSWVDMLAAERRGQEDRLKENLAAHPKTWEAVRCGLGRDIYPLALIGSAHLMDLDELAKAVVDAWTMPDSPQTQLSHRDWLGYFNEVGYLDNATRRPFPTESITVWRGATPSRRRRWSWTTDRERAAWFANRLTYAGLDARVWTLTAPPSARLAHFHGGDSRDEDEHVINTSGLSLAEVTHG
ncbi:hypothetical protein HII28_02110 [Planctomonas sp. JC2975]|uniref:hypothetical protein n=1 Tax=Planctomonas sp. JC2975 TaxID=2729626 RepID=UPI0014751FD4|nr:hypothetical protein [Planctomonas sp. JC2975]NNC10681.1 hypothetical protein [Planctomonas sp. JC2975]